MINWLFQSKLQQKVLATMLLTSVAPLLLLGVVSLYSLSVFHRLDLERIEQTLLDELAAEVNARINSVAESMELQVNIYQTDDIQLLDQHKLLKSYLEAIAELEEISFISLRQDTDKEKRFGKETSLLRRGEKNFLPAEELTNQRNMEKFKRGSQGQRYISEVYYTLKGPMVTIAVPVHNSPVGNEAPAVISVLSGEVKLNGLQKLLSQTKLGNTGYAYLLDKNGIVVADSRSAELVGDYVSKRTVSQLAYYQSNNQKVAGMAEAIGTLKGLLVVEWPADDADAIINTIRQQLIIAVAIVLLLVIILSVYLSSKIVRPIKILEKGAALVAMGKFDQHVSIKTKDELEQLGSAFNQMIDGLKRLEELKEEFVFIASHELRTPVTAIKGYLSLVISGDYGTISNEVKETLVKVNDANQRLIQLVEDLLQVARSEAGKLTIDVAPTDSSETIKNVIKELEPLGRQKNIAVTYQAINPAAQILADPMRLREVLVNLVGNAIKYTLGSGRVTISQELKGDELITHVADSGIGMSPDEQKKLFEKFYRIKNEQTSKITGTGLGLFIVKQIIEKMNGRIWVTSEKGKGSTFSFSLKLAKIS